MAKHHEDRPESANGCGGDGAAESERGKQTPVLRMVVCQGCGAGLPIELGRDTVRCVFCEGEQTVPELERVTDTEARTASAQREGLEALEQAHAERLEPTRTQETVAWFAWLIVTANVLGVVGLVVVSAGIAGEEALVVATYGALGLSLLGWYASKRWLRRRAGKKAKKLAREAHEQLAREAHPAKCPNCGGPVQVPHEAAAMDCPFCRTALLASDGMLVRWMRSAAARRQLWLSQATRLIEQRRQLELRAAQRAPLVTSIAVIGIGLVSGATMSATLPFLELTELEIICRGRCRIDGMTCLSGGKMWITMRPGVAKRIDLWVAPDRWQTELVTLKKGEQRTFICPPTPNAPPPPR